MKILRIWDTPGEVFYKLKGFRFHRRLKVFWLKGLSCVHCKCIGNAILKTKNKVGQIHFDLYRLSEHGRRLMTVDHIIPKSLGGTNDIDNLQPMCCKCNQKKGSTVCLPYIPLTNDNLCAIV